jgi:predicted transcriptional regulator
MVDFKVIIREMRSIIGVSRSELAKKSGVSEKFIRRLENGESVASMEKVGKVMVYLSQEWFVYCCSLRVLTEKVEVPQTKSNSDLLLNIGGGNVTKL